MNKLKLKAAMVLKELSTEAACSEIGISKSAWFRKVSGESEFTQSEICKLRDLLALDDHQTAEIFFDRKVS
jgi:hypothetical protein